MVSYSLEVAICVYAQDKPITEIAKFYSYLGASTLPLS